MILPEWDFTRKEQVWIGDLSVAQKEELLRKSGHNYDDKITVLYHYEYFTIYTSTEPKERFNRCEREGGFTTLEINPKPTRVIDLSSVLG